MTYWWMDEIEILSSVDSLIFSINIGDILRMKIYCIYDFLSPVEDNKRSYDQVNGVDLENLLMMPKCSPVRYTIPALEQPVPENKKVQRKAFKGGGPVWSRPNTLRRLSQKTLLQL